jgi:hypothetical protein
MVSARLGYLRSFFGSSQELTNPIYGQVTGVFVSITRNDNTLVKSDLLGELAVSTTKEVMFT